MNSRQRYSIGQMNEPLYTSSCLSDMLHVQTADSWVQGLRCLSIPQGVDCLERHGPDMSLRQPCSLIIELGEVTVSGV